MHISLHSYAPYSTPRRTQRAIITREFAGWTGPVELNATDPTDVVVGHVPAPGCDGVPLFDGDLHGVDMTSGN